MKLANFNKTAYLRDWKVAHRSYERSQYSNFKTALNEQNANVVSYIKSHGTYNLQAHLTVLVTPQPLQDAYLKCYTKVGTQHAEWMYNKIDRIAKKAEAKSAPGFFSEHWRKLMSLFYHTDAGKRIKDVTDTTRDRITKLLDESQDMTLSEQAIYITDNLNDPDFNVNRALVIARTESTAAANYGASLGAESNDYETGKMWLSVMDVNTRPTHVDANEQTIASDELFVVGGELAQFPGDLSLSAAEVIQCRCCLAIVPLVGVNGLPILK